MFDFLTLSRKSAKNLGFLLYVILTLFLVCSLPFELNFLFLNILLFLLNIFKVTLFFFSGKAVKKDSLFESKISDEDLPYYSVMLPLYKEGKIIKQLITKIKEIDYPKEKLEVLLVLEEGDVQTLEWIKKVDCNFKIIIVPESFPKTKGKACNYAVNFVKGDYLTIYDAEDIPDKLQLKQVVQKFSDLTADYTAIQARLNYYNNDYNILTKLFSLEYSLQFDYLFPTLEMWGGFLPLGGSSNHLKVKDMKKIYWWDSFNVTEDIDLAVRIFMDGKQVSCVNSMTWEQSPTDVLAWIKQRSRWIKGFLQTFIVHMKSPIVFLQTIRWKRFVSFNFMTIIPIIVNFCSPLFLFLPFLNGINDYIYYFSYINFFIAVTIALMMNIAIIKKFKWYNHWSALPFIPLYWILSFFATLKAIYELMVSPYYWDKTMH